MQSSQNKYHVIIVSALLVSNIVANLSLLFIFKYLNHRFINHYFIIDPRFIS